MSYPTISPQPLSSAINFIDDASTSKEQLEAMVNARSPYSMIALSKLQAMRDAAMKAQAKQPTPPPMTEYIPQQIAQLRSGVMSPEIMPQGAMPQGGMPPMPQQPMQQGIASIGGAPTGVRGGVVAFNGIKGSQVEEEETSRAGDLLRSLPYALGLNTEAQAKEAAKRIKEQREMFGPDYQKRRDLIFQSYKAQPGFFEAVTPSVKKAREAESKRLLEQAQVPGGNQQSTILLNPPPIIYTEAMMEADNPRMVVSPAPVSYKSDPPTKADPSAEAQKTISALLPTNRDLAGVQKAQEDYLRYLEDVAKKPTWNEADYKKALGDRTADTKKFYTELEGIFPDSTQEFRNQIKTLKEENLSEKTKAPYQGLLKMSLSLMSNTGRNFLDALGKAGATGMEEYNSIMQMNKRQNLLLMESDAKMAVAQDNRRNNLYGLASSQAAEAKQDRIRAFDLEKDSKAQQVGLAVKIAEIKAGTPLKMMELRTNLARAGASIYSAYKTDSPEAVKLWRFAQSNPEFAAYLQTQENVKRASTGYLALSKQYDDELRAATAAGQDQFPSRDTWMSKQFIEYMKVTDPSVRGKMPGS